MLSGAAHLKRKKEEEKKNPFKLLKTARIPSLRIFFKDKHHQSFQLFLISHDLKKFFLTGKTLGLSRLSLNVHVE